MPALLLNVSKLLMPPLLELLPAVPLLPASKPTALILTVTTAPLPTPTKLLLPQVVSTPLAPTKLLQVPSAHLQLLQHPADLLFHQVSMLLQETPPSPEPTRPLLLLLELMPLPLDAPLLANSQPLLLMFLLNLSKGMLPSPMLTELLPLPPPPLISVTSEVSPTLEDSPLDLVPKLLVVHPVSLVPTPVPSEVSEPPPLLSLKERKLLLTQLLHLSVMEPSLPRVTVPTEVTALMVAMALTVVMVTLDSLTLSLPTVAPMEATVDMVATVATVDTNKNGDQGSVTF